MIVTTMHCLLYNTGRRKHLYYKYSNARVQQNPAQSDDNTYVRSAELGGTGGGAKHVQGRLGGGQGQVRELRRGRGWQPQEVRRLPHGSLLQRRLPEAGLGPAPRPLFSDLHHRAGGQRPGSRGD